MDKRYPVLLEETYQLSSSTGECKVELSSSVELPEKALAIEVHFDGTEMNKKLAKKLKLSWSDGLQSAFFYSRLVTEHLWNQHPPFLIPKGATGIRIVIRKWNWDGSEPQPRMMLRLSSKTDATEFPL